MSKKTTVKKRCAIHPRPQGDEGFWHSFIKVSEIMTEAYGKAVQELKS